MPARKRDRYRHASGKAKGPGPDTTASAPVVPRNTVSIDRRAGTGRSGLGVGDRVRIVGSGLYAGEAAVIERLTGSVVPAAFVRTESGGTRQVRTIDLEPIRETAAVPPEARPDARDASAAGSDAADGR